MVIDNIKFALRQFKRNRLFSFINLIGLITGLTVCLLIAQFVWFEYSFESFNKNADRTYRVNLYNTSNGVFEGISSGTVPGLAYSMQQTLPGIDAIGRLSSKVNALVSSSDGRAKNLETNILFADASIFDLLGIDIRLGEKRLRLKVLNRSSFRNQLH